MGLADVILDYGLGIGFILVSGFLVLFAYYLGYQFGHQVGFRQGVISGCRFSRLKVREQNYNNN